MQNSLISAIKKSKRIEVFMSVILLIAITTIACNMDKVAEKESKSAVKNEKNGKVVVIDPGHGGADPGKVGINKAKEKDVNLSIAKVLEQTLKENGFDVVLTREEDSNLGNTGKFSKVGDLNARCEIINDTYLKNKQCILISIHQNSFTQESVHGAQSFYYQRSEESKKLSELMQAHLNKEINVEREKKAKPNDSYYMLINSKCPGIIIECGFLSNREEAIKLVSPDYQEKLSQIICASVKEYFDIK